MKHLSYFNEEVPLMVKNLTESSNPSFGIMSAQHMIEHLIWVTKSSVKDMGPAPDLLTDSQLKFMSFIDKGAEFKYRPSDKTKNDLGPLKFKSIESAISELSVAIARMIQALEGKSKAEIFYNPMMGSLTADQMELFHKKHYEWHLEKQFKLQ